MNTFSNKLRTVLICFSLLLCSHTVSICQDTTRTGLKGLAFGVNLGSNFGIGSFGMNGKYWLNEHFTPIVGVRFSGLDNSTIYRSPFIPSQKIYSASFSILGGIEYHLLKNQQFSPFIRSTLSPYFSTVAGYGNSTIFDSGGIFASAGIGIECFIIPSISISVIQNINFAYAWGNGIQFPSGIGDGKALSVSNDSPVLLLHIYFR